MNLIQLSRVDLSGSTKRPDSPVWVNVLTIVSVERVASCEHYSLRMLDGETFAVREGPDEIMALARPK